MPIGKSSCSGSIGSRQTVYSMATRWTFVDCMPVSDTFKYQVEGEHTTVPVLLPIDMDRAKGGVEKGEKTAVGESVVVTSQRFSHGSRA